MDEYLGYIKLGRKRRKTTGNNPPHLSLLLEQRLGNLLQFVGFLDNATSLNDPLILS